MKIEFDTRYIALLDGNLKAAMMLAVSVATQIEFNKTHEPDEYGWNYWGMTVEQWQRIGIGTDKPQKKIREILKKYDFYNERMWGKNDDHEGIPPHMQYHIKLEKLDEALKTIEALR